MQVVTEHVVSISFEVPHFGQMRLFSCFRWKLKTLMPSREWKLV